MSYGTTDYEDIEYVVEGPTAVITMNRPQRYNAFRAKTVEEMINAFRRAWADRNPAADARLKAARPLVEQLAADLRMPTENLLTPDTLRRIAWMPPSDIDEASIGDALADHGARPWQVDLTAPVIARAFVDSVQPPAGASGDAS